MQLLNTPILRKPKSDIAIARIKIKDKCEQIEIIYELPPEDKETKKVTFKCSDRPDDAFFKALEILTKEAVLFCKISWEDPELVEISFKTTEEDDFVSFSLNQQIAEATVACSVKSLVPSLTLRDKYNNFLAEVEDYIAGKRAQQSLFNDEQMAGLGF